MLTEDQEKAVIDLLGKTAKSNAYKNGAYQKLTDAARNYAMMKATGTYLDNNGTLIRASASDVQPRIEYYLNDMKFAAESMFIEEALAGAGK